MKWLVPSLLLWPAVASQLRARGCPSWSCSEGYVPKLRAAKGASDEECCSPTCRLHSCGLGYVGNTSYDNNTGTGDAECCDRACGGSLADGDFVCGELQKVGHPARAGASAEECCDATCATFTCEGNWTHHPSKENSTGNSEEECCVPKCHKVHCDAGYIHDEAKLEDQGGTQEECCVKSCELFSCEADGFAIPTNKRKQKALSAAECCQPQCRQHVCSVGWAKDAGKDSVYEPSDEQCCLMQCQAFQCPNGWTSDPAKRAQMGNSKEQCCLPPCSLRTCKGGFLPKAAFGWSEEECCEASCGTHHCPRPLVLAPSRASLAPASDALCCEDAGCGELRRLEKVTSCNGLAKEHCGKGFENFPNQTGIALWARCSFDEALKLCRLGPEHHCW